MPCENSITPEYLHWDGETVLAESQFEKDDVLYRTRFSGNPIAWPNCMTAFSCKWNKLIKLKDVLLITPEKLGNEIAYAKIGETQEVEVKMNCELPDNPIFGEHILTCSVVHKPLDCDFSHAEVLIRHECQESGVEIDRVYQYEDWGNKTICIMSRKRPRFLKDLRTEYRSQINSIFNKTISPNN